jgi:hypothetical protein
VYIRTLSPQGATTLAAPSGLNPSRSTIDRDGRSAPQSPPEAEYHLSTPTVCVKTLTPHGTSDTASFQHDYQYDLARTGFVSAAPYFQMRWPRRPKSGENICHYMVIATDARRDSLHYPEPNQTWLRREVELPDWMNFTNYLLPIPLVNSNASFGQKELEEGLERISIGQTPPGSQGRRLTSRNLYSL